MRVGPDVAADHAPATLHPGADLFVPAGTAVFAPLGATVVRADAMVGVEFSVAFIMNRILDALPEDSGQLGHAHGGRMLGAHMPFWYTGSLVLGAIWAVAGWRHHGAGLVVTAVGLLIVSVVLSMLLLVPINNRNKSWTPDNRPADGKQQLHRRGRYHYVRVAVIIAAFTLLVAALA